MLLRSSSIRSLSSKIVEIFRRYDPKCLLVGGVLAAMFETALIKNAFNVAAKPILSAIDVLFIIFQVFLSSFNVCFTFLEFVLTVKLFKPVFKLFKYIFVTNISFCTFGF